MTDQERMKGLECCSEFLCGECPYNIYSHSTYKNQCSVKLIFDIKELFDRREAELELMRRYIHSNNLEYDLLSYKRRILIDDE